MKNTDSPQNQTGIKVLGGWVIYSLRQVKRLVILVIGSTVVLLGFVMLVTPGPAVVVIPAGLAILATEFVWARRLLHQVKNKILDMANSKSTSSSPPPPPDKPE